jgi:hypothetical protein
LTPKSLRRLKRSKTLRGPKGPLCFILIVNPCGIQSFTPALYLAKSRMDMPKKVSSASDTDFRREINKAIPGNAVTAALGALTVANVLLGRHVAKRRKSRRG